MQTEGSGEVMRLYFEEGLQLKQNMANSVGQVRMLNYVREGVMRCDGRKLAEPTGLEGFVGYTNIIRNCVLSGTNTFISDWEAGRSAREAAMREAYENFGRIQQ